MGIEQQALRHGGTKARRVCLTRLVVSSCLRAFLPSYLSHSPFILPPFPAIVNLCPTSTKK